MRLGRKVLLGLLLTGGLVAGVIWWRHLDAELRAARERSSQAVSVAEQATAAADSTEAQLRAYRTVAEDSIGRLAARLDTAVTQADRLASELDTLRAAARAGSTQFEQSLSPWQRGAFRQVVARWERTVSVADSARRAERQARELAEAQAAVLGGLVRGERARGDKWQAAAERWQAAYEAEHRVSQLLDQKLHPPFPLGLFRDLPKLAIATGVGAVACALWCP